MSRVDVPTLKCDRCGRQTQDLTEMAAFTKLTRYHESGHYDWDLCPGCSSRFRDFMGGLDDDSD